MNDKNGLPSDVETERLVLGAILTDPDAWPSVCELLDADSFALTDHQRIWRACSNVADSGAGIDRITVAHALDGHLAKIGGLSRLAELDTGLPRIHDLGAYAGKLAGLARRRRALLLTSRLEALLSTGNVEDAQNTLADLSEAILARKRGGSEWLSPEQIVNDAGGMYELVRRPSEIGAIVPPWPSIAKMIPGFFPGQLIVIAARPGVGKTIALTQILEAAVQQGRPTRMASLEMLSRDLLTRMACAAANVSQGHIVFGYATEAEKRAFFGALEDLYRMQIKIRDGSSATVAALAAAVRRDTACRCLIVDYLGLLDGPGKDIYQRMTGISRALKQLALAAQIPVIVAAQLNRQTKAEKRAPELHDLRDSGAIEQDADVVCLLAEKEPLEGGDQRVDWIIAKQRRGSRGCVPMIRRGQYLRLEEC